ncbi:choline dehydrogenase [Defluviimonas salinarum]|uniref:Choline dehydrogenase n=1 Tax=Defluviimonas salinarum TaxID=2992147 RepID=A0ABT3J7G8_9RHOB|nr:choline dehydrogenase [Defluviimonas salinarum]MCW3783623.1 choline dehydrogenase [Defluviimonas salinarum]
MREVFDYIIVGAGSAGSVLAEKLSASGRHRVLLLEAGGTDINPFVAAPVGETQLLETRWDWAFKGEPEERLGNHRLVLSRGRCLGGSSSINGQLCFRGHPGDYDRWARMGNDGWAYKDVLPLFRDMERWEGGGNEYRGDKGPLRTARGYSGNPMFQAFVDAGVQAGYRETNDFNGPEPEGFGHCQHTHYHWPILRCSASYAFLLKARWTRKNLEIRKGATVHKIVLDGKKAVGVRYERKGQMHEARANAEVIVSCSPYQSPKLLMVSGIGPAAHLKEHNVRVVHDLPGVGQNLMDQLGSFVQHDCLLPITYYRYKNPIRAFGAVLEWLFLSRGPATLFPMASSGLVKSSPEVELPDLQFYMFPAAVNPHSEGTYDFKHHGFNVHWGLVHPKSRGTVRLRSSDPTAAPVIHNNFFSHEDDRILNRKAFRIARELLKQPALDKYRGEEIAPGPDCVTDEQIDEHTSRYFANHYHPSGTCKMGVDDMAVVDPKLRVHGMQNLRVIDSSIMPIVVTGGLNVPSMMIGANGAKFILDEQR